MYGRREVRVRCNFVAMKKLLFKKMKSIMGRGLDSVIQMQQFSPPQSVHGWVVRK